MHAGGGAYTDSLGQTWSADTGFSGGNVYSTTSSINNTLDPALYQTERYGAFSYQFTVPNGSYNVVLKFAEIYWNSSGQRIFNVSINGTQVLTNFDIVAAAGAPLTAIDKTFPVTVTNGTITIQFIPGSADWPKVSAINLVRLPSTSTLASTTTSTAQGQLSLSQTSFAFGNVDIGTTASQTFTVSNTGTATITFSGVSVSGAGFNATGVSSGVMLNPGQSTTLTATFAPAAAGAATGSVAFTSNAANPSAAICALRHGRSTTSCGSFCSSNMGSKHIIGCHRLLRVSRSDVSWAVYRLERVRRFDDDLYGYYCSVWTGLLLRGYVGGFKPHSECVLECSICYGSLGMVLLVVTVKRRELENQSRTPVRAVPTEFVVPT